MFRARGKLLLFADADGATTFSEYGRVEDSLKNACKGLGDSLHVQIRLSNLNSGIGEFSFSKIPLSLFISFTNNI